MFGAHPFLLATMDWNAIIALGGLGVFGVVGFQAARDTMSQRREREQEKRKVQAAADEADRRAKAAELDEDLQLRNRVKRLERLLVGEPDDPATGMPGTPGIIATWDRFMARTTDELTIAGNGTLKSAVERLDRTAKAIDTTVKTLLKRLPEKEAL